MEPRDGVTAADRAAVEGAARERVLPLGPLAQIGFAVAFGVLLDTLVVRSLLVPAPTCPVGPRVRWPGRLAHVPDREEDP